MAKRLKTAATYRSHKWEDETGSDASANISDRQHKSSGYALLVRHVGQGQELEVVGCAGGLVHSVGQIQRPAAALRPVVTRHGSGGAALFCHLTHELNLCLGWAWILLEDIEGHHDWYPKQVCNLDLLPEIASTTACNETQVLREKQTKQKKRSDSCNQHHHVGPEP
ncbi:hypothetical protein EYF80_021273 [Liparis tanakae]|uniref:Uncharacterized protein n=1 Tax=Liparis tanakae TaxID=230148 RepID=A0A4Z2HRW3_9TELE|nr:hypothetical protein EYF80_021273 [Liparis tanakae]